MPSTTSSATRRDDGALAPAFRRAHHRRPRRPAEANGQIVGPGAYGHFPGDVPMHHAPAGDEGCLFLILFDGPFDVEPVDR